MPRLIEIENKTFHRFLSVNFLMAELMDLQLPSEQAINTSPLERYSLKEKLYVPSTDYMNNMINVVQFYRAVSRTFDIGKCRKVS